MHCSNKNLALMRVSSEKFQDSPRKKELSLNIFVVVTH